MRRFWYLPWVLTLGACAPPPPLDTRPPRLVGAAVSEDGRELDLDFDETLASAKTGGNFGPGAVRHQIAGAQVQLALPPDLSPGKAYEWTAEVRDPGTNLTSVRGRFFGPNGHPAAVRLNEIRIAGSGTHPDLAELRVEEPGSLGGWVLEVWSSPENRIRFVFPDREAAAGELVVVHFKPAGIPGERDETGTQGDSIGADASPQAWDFWVPGGKGLPGTRGLVVLRPRVGSPPTDGLLYSQTPGEGTALAEAAGWPGREEQDPRGCTPTRTWSRDSGPPGNWILGATGTSTPGLPNKLIPWAGPASNPKGTPRSRG